jgi:hypothetical protein
MPNIPDPKSAALEMLAHVGAQPDTLSPTELQLDKEPLTRRPVARPVKAWVRYGAVPLFVEAEAVAWTEHAVAIRWRTPEGEHRAWV